LDLLQKASVDSQRSIEHMRVLLGAARLAEAGAFAVEGREEEAIAVLSLIGDASLSDSNEVEESRSIVGRPGKHADGEWSKAFDDASNNERNQLEVLRELRQRSLLASDLKPLDAVAFVDAVWRGGSSAIRSTARSIAIEEFVNGPRVALELLDRSDRAALNNDTLEFVEAFTNEVMPSNSAKDARLRMRRALARKALSLHDPLRDPVDRLAEAIRTTVANRVRIQDTSLSVPVSATLADVASMSADAMRLKAQRRLFADPFPASIESLDATRASRGWLAVTQPQRLVAALVAEVDFLAYIVAADIPSARAEVMESLERGVLNRDRAATAVQQAIETLLELAKLERLRLEPRMRSPLEGRS
jgi:hypothetical protein